MNNEYLFNEKKLTQATAFFIYKSQGKINILKLMKLLYLSERLSFKKFHEPMIGDSLVSMKRGPVLSMTLDLIDGGGKKDSFWEKWISDRSNHQVALKKPNLIESEDDLLELSEDDILILSEIWQEFGGRDQWELVEYTHNYCPEWRDPGSSCSAIDYNTLFDALGFSAGLKREIKEHLNEQIDLAKNKQQCLQDVRI